MKTKKKRKLECDGSGDDEECAAKSARSSVICGACRARATGAHAVPWAKTEGKSAKPVGQRCAGCSSLHMAAFRYLDWKQYCKLAETEDCSRQKNNICEILGGGSMKTNKDKIGKGLSFEGSFFLKCRTRPQRGMINMMMLYQSSVSLQDGKALVAQAKEFQQHPQNKPWDDEEMETHVGSWATVERSYIIMNLQEFKKHYRHNPKSKDPVLKQVRVCDVDGNEEDVFVFKPPGEAFRRLTLHATAGEVVKKKAMQPKTHLHEKQGERMLKHSCEARMSETQLSSLLGASSSQAIVTVEEYGLKLKKKYHGGDGKKQKASSCGDSEDEGDDGGEAVAGGGADQDSSSETEGPDGDMVASSSAQHRGSSSMGPLARGKSSESLGSSMLLITPDEKRSRCETPSTGKLKLDRAPTVDLEKETLSSADLNSIPDANLSDTQRLAKYVAKLTLPDALAGKKKGIQVHHAEDCIKKMEPAMGNQLRCHVRLFQQAKSISPREVATTPASEVQAAVQALSPMVKQWPSQILIMLWQKHARSLLTKVLAEGKEADIEEFYEFTRPYRLQSDTKELKIITPELYAILLEPEKKVGYYCDLCVKELLVPLLMSGEDKATFLTFLLAKLQQKAKLHLPEDLADAALVMLSDFQTFGKAVAAIMEEDAWKQLDGKEAVEHVLQACKQLGNKPLSIMSAALVESRFYKERLDAYIGLSAKMSVHQPKLEIVLQKLDIDLAGKDTLEQLNQLVSELLYLTEELDLSTLSPLINKAIQKLQDYWSWCQDQLANDKAALDMEELKKLWVEASLVFPTHNVFNEYRSEVEKLQLKMEGSGRMNAFLKFVTMLETELAETSSVQVAYVDEFLGAAKAAKGLQLEAAVVGQVQKLANKVIGCLETSSVDGSKVGFQMLEALASWLPQDMQDKDLKLIKTVLDLEQVLPEMLPSTEVSLSDKIMGEKGKENLKKLMQLGALTKKLAGGEKAWGSEQSG